jgi:branched-chain amino acid transport system substrate-binding protein
MCALFLSKNLLTVVLSIAGLSILTPAHAEISNGTVRVGVMNDMSGPYAGNGGPGTVQAVQMAIEDFGGKVNGHPIEVVSADDQNKPDIGLNIARQWIERDNVDAIIGGSASSIALAVQALMKSKEKPYLIVGSLTSDLTGKSCSPMAIQFLPDTYAQSKANVRALLQQGMKTFYFVTVDYAFGQAMQSAATQFIEEGGGKVLGSVKHPINTADFASYLMQAQSSGANAIMLASAGHDTANELKQAQEFGLGQSGQALAGMGMTIDTIGSIGLDLAQRLRFSEPFYWDRDEESRQWSKRYMERMNGKAPTLIHAGAYTAMTQYLKAVQATDSDAGPTVIAKMKATTIDDFEMKNVSIRQDGQVMRPMYAVQVKSPAESKGKNDFYKVGAEMAANDIYRPLSEGGCDFVKSEQK